MRSEGESCLRSQTEKKGKETRLHDDTSHMDTKIHWGPDDSYCVRFLERKKKQITGQHTCTTQLALSHCAPLQVRICILPLVGRPTNCPGSRRRRRGEKQLGKYLIRLALSAELARLTHLTSTGWEMLAGGWRPEGLAAMAGPSLPGARPGVARRPVSPPELALGP